MPCQSEQQRQHAEKVGDEDEGEGEAETETMWHNNGTSGRKAYGLI